MKNTYIRQENQNHQDFRFANRLTHPLPLFIGAITIGLVALAIHVQSQKILGIGIADLCIGFLKASFIGVVTALCVICMTAFVVTVTPTPIKKALQFCCSAMCIFCFLYAITCHVYGLYIMAPLRMEFKATAQEISTKKDPELKNKLHRIIQQRDKQLAQENLSAKQVEWLADSDGSVAMSDCYLSKRLEGLMVNLKVVADSKKQQ